MIFFDIFLDIITFCDIFKVGYKKVVIAMKTLIIIGQAPKMRLLVDLHTKELIREVKSLIERKRHSEAIIKVLSKGRFQKEVQYDDLNGVKADLILSKKAVSWDLT